MVSNVLKTYGKNFYGRGKEVRNGRGAKAVTWHKQSRLPEAVSCFSIPYSNRSRGSKPVASRATIFCVSLRCMRQVKSREMAEVSSIRWYAHFYY